MQEVLPQRQTPVRTRSRTWTLLTAIWGFAIVAILPVLFHWTARPPRISRTSLAGQLGWVAAAIICYCFYRAESRRLPRLQAIGLVLVIFLLTSFANNLHSFYVDKTSNYFVTIPNERWQENLQNDVVRLSPSVAPHSYRFLPNGIVAWMQLANVRFSVARDVYRLLFGLLLFYAIYRFARLYTSHAGAVLAMLLVAVVYPISFEWYAGQLTDPLSHLSFVLAFIFLETANFPLLLTTLLIGSVAKESVLALVGFYILFCRRERRYLLKACVLAITSAAVYFGIRLYVFKGVIHYNQVSGVGPSQFWANWYDPRWPALFLITACAYLPFLVLGWKQTPLLLKRMVFFLVPVLFFSSMLFSWMTETRNFMPVVFVLAVVAARYFARSTAPEEDSYMPAQRMNAAAKIPPQTGPKIGTQA
ncbi:MAG TPA: hypothetical protein VLI55_21500 [Bryobacteraceae bacterium]|nr:hypothetical protein [Bryobacteraceae bacterium]